MIERSHIVSTARGYIGTPFHHQGRSVHGMDCVGLLVCIARDLGINVRDNTTYPRIPDPAELLAGLERNGLRRLESGKDAGPGDVVVFWCRPKSREAHHVAVLTEEGTLVHALSELGRVMETPYDERWQAQTLFAYTWGGV